jgi:hypothetical protein
MAGTKKKKKKEEEVAVYHIPFKGTPPETGRPPSLKIPAISQQHQGK